MLIMDEQIHQFSYYAVTAQMFMFDTWTDVNESSQPMNQMLLLINPKTYREKQTLRFNDCNIMTAAIKGGHTPLCKYNNVQREFQSINQSI